GIPSHRVRLRAARRTASHTHPEPSACRSVVVMAETGSVDDLAGRGGVVTGASKGVGRGGALHLARGGGRVVGAARRAPAVDAVAGELDEIGAKVVADTVDVADRDGMIAVVDRAADRWGRVDGLVANAQSFRSVTPLEDVTERDMDVLYDTGVKGTLWSMQA